MNKELLDTFIKVNTEYYGNSNSLHKLGLESKKLENAATNQILDIFKLKNKEVIYTSGNVENNNLLIFGLLSKYKDKNKNKNVIVYKDEITIIECLKHIDYVNTIIIDDIKELKDKINNNTILVCISKDIEYVLDVIKEYNCFYHINYNNQDINTLNKIDFISVEEPDIPGFGCLIKNKSIVINPLIYGGKSTTVYRSGTPNLPFIVCFSKLLKNKYKK